jgi:small subunit ribosomal protein S21
VPARQWALGERQAESQALRTRIETETNGQNPANPAAIQSFKAQAGTFCAQRGFEGGKGVNDLATVTLREGESQESLLKRFRKEVMQERILSEARRKRWYISPSEMRRIQRQRAIRRARRRQRQREARRRY